ncbi:MAG: triosephosphate isomerase [Bacilli bacterium]|nr:triosephosphate isomerase [Bacilli bacterium]
MLIILNHKSNLTYEEIKKYEKTIRNMEVIVLPSLCYMALFKKGKYILGSQDISEFIDTSRTGEVNGEQLKSIKVKYCLIGHSERKIYNKETEETTLIKLNNCVENNITPLYCIGEQNDNEIINKEIDLILNKYNNKEILFIYEPIENIGKVNPDLEKVEENINYIRNYIKNKYNKDIKLIYGGGVNINNIDKVKKIKNIDGIILSKDSLNLEHLKLIYKKCK